MTFDFSNLTRTQRAVLLYGGWNRYDRRSGPKPRDKTLRPLLERKLLVAQYGGSTLIGYTVPKEVAQALSLDGKSRDNEIPSNGEKT